MKLHKNTICKLKGLTAVILCTAALMVLGSCSMGLLSDANPAQTTASSYTLQAIEGYTDLFQINGTFGGRRADLHELRGFCI